jgi:Ras GTPase-activating-like protein IQGAP2/3
MLCKGCCLSIFNIWFVLPQSILSGILTTGIQAPERDDPLRAILHELGGVPNLGGDSDELNDARDTAVTLELTNRFANVRGRPSVSVGVLNVGLTVTLDPRAEEKTLWVQAKRAVLAILRVQPAKDLVEALMKPVTQEHEAAWEEIIENEMIMDHKQRNRRMPSTAGAEYRLEDIREYVDSFVAC